MSFVPLSIYSKFSPLLSSCQKYEVILDTGVMVLGGEMKGSLGHIYIYIHIYIEQIKV
jgi:hypothetical protein